MSHYNNFRVIDSKDQFKRKALTALGISVAADILDYIAAPIFAVPLIGDVFDALTIALLYNVTKSKFSATLNMMEFIPVIGDLLPVYTFSTLAWIIKEVAEIYLREPIKRRGTNVLTKPFRFFDKLLMN
ncbi:MAG: hypothetical protein WB975_14055 [Nitrososphaeraceae archaeon]